MAITPLSGDHGSGLTTSKGGLMRKNWDVIIEDFIKLFMACFNSANLFQMGKEFA